MSALGFVAAVSQVGRLWPGAILASYLESGPVLGVRSPRRPQQAGAGGDMLGGQEVPEARGWPGCSLLSKPPPPPSPGRGVGIEEQARRDIPSPRPLPVQVQRRGVQAGLVGRVASALVWSSLCDGEARFIFPEKAIPATAHRVMERTLVSNANAE